MEADRLYVKWALNSTEGEKKEHNKIPKPKQKTWGWGKMEEIARWPQINLSSASWIIIVTSEPWRWTCQYNSSAENVVSKTVLERSRKGLCSKFKCSFTVEKKKKSVSKVKHHCCLQICQLISKSLITIFRDCSMRLPLCLVIVKTQ